MFSVLYMFVDYLCLFLLQPLPKKQATPATSDQSTTSDETEEEVVAPSTKSKPPVRKNSVKQNVSI